MTDTNTIKDPFFAREQQKYADPIPSREFILELLQQYDGPLKFKQILNKLNLLSKQHKIALKRRLAAMVRDAQLQKIKTSFYLANRMRLLKGIVLIENKGIYVQPKGAKVKIKLDIKKNVVRHNSQVLISIPDIDLKPGIIGKLVEILQESELTITGKFVEDFDFNYVVPFNNKSILDNILIPKGKELQAKDGSIVTVLVDKSSSKINTPIGVITEIVGSEDDFGIEVETAIRSHDLPYKWPKNLTEKIKVLNSKKNIPANVIKNRVDLRDLPLVTIDGDDSRDFDDAVFCETKTGGGWRLYVAIADVSYYVKPNSALDKEALLRGNSVYFPKNVLPMLPEILSNKLCSLCPNVDRLCMVCELTISKVGKITRYKFYEAVMQSKARLTYNQAAEIINNKKSILRSKYKNLLKPLEDLHQMYLALLAARKQRGAIDFDTVETKINFNKKGKIQSIEPVTRQVSHKIIEECMLAANVATAKFLQKHKIPGLYRIHEHPAEDKLANLKKFLKDLGLSLTVGKPAKLVAQDYAMLLDRVKDRHDVDIIQKILLRSMSQAIYSQNNCGHFGLAYKEYTHFTSPIRRYPDLIVHRQIKMLLANKPLTATQQAKQEEQLESIGQHCSMTERRADEASRSVTQWLKCQYMAKHIGKTFSGTISSVTKFGLFVELKDLYIDGLVHINNLRDDYYIFDSVHNKLTGEVTNNVYALGDQVKVIVSRVNINERKIDLELITTTKKISTKKLSKKQKKSKKLDKKDLSTKSKNKSKRINK